MSWLEKFIPSKIRTTSKQKKGVPEGLWTKCNACEAILYRSELEKNQSVCPKCSHHLRISARTRLQWFLDEGSQYEIGEILEPVDTLKFKDSKRYKERFTSAQKKTGEKDALVALKGSLNARPVVACAFEFDFMGGSMGAVVGERFVQSVECALKNKAPFICFTASGGARMQEALISLMQMAKTSCALTQLEQEKIPFITILTDPTMGGVSASLAMLGDVILAEPNALIGFAGPRVIQQTVRETLPEGFQRSEFLLEHGAIDMIVDRRELKATITQLLDHLSTAKPSSLAHA